MKKTSATVKKTSSENAMIRPTGIEGLDNILNGGLPMGSVVLLAGHAGSGKTVLSQQWLFEGWNKLQEAGIYISMTEPVKKSIKNVRQFNFFADKPLSDKKIVFTDLSNIMTSLNVEESARITRRDADAIIEAICAMALDIDAKRVVLDSLTAILYRLEDKDLIRYFMFKLGTALSYLDVTVLLVSEVPTEGYSVFGVEEFIADGIISLTNIMGEQSMIRRLSVVKMRGTEFRSGAVGFDIAKEGIVIYPKIPIDRSVMKVEYAVRKKTGIAALDRMVDGGYPEGHTILIGGNTGAGKSTFGLQFLVQGIEDGEPAVFVAIEESVPQIKRIALAHGWDLDAYEKAGKLIFLNPSVIDLNSDRLLYDIINAVDSIGAKRVNIDSISSLETATLDSDSIREFLLQMTMFFKMKGILCTMMYLTTEAFGAASGQLLGGTQSSELRLSSIVDGILLLRYVERAQSVRTLITVLKMRGSTHSRDIHEYTIATGGVKIGQKFKA